MRSINVSSCHAFTSQPSGGLLVVIPASFMAPSAMPTSSSRMKRSMSCSVAGPPRAHAASPPARAKSTPASRSAAAARLSASRMASDISDGISSTYPAVDGPTPTRASARQRIEPERLTDHRERDVAHGDASGSDTVLDPMVRVTVDDEVGTGAVDRLAEQVAPQERKDLEPLATERVLDRREVQQRDPYVGVERGERSVERIGESLRRLHECLHLGLAEVARARAGESATEPLRPRNPHRGPADVDHVARPLQHPDAGVLEQSDE